MANVRISERLPWLLNSHLAPVAYGSWALPKLVLELQQPDTLTRQRALASLCDLAHDPEKAYQAIQNGCLEQLKLLLRDNEPSIRTRTSELLFLLVAHSVGREAFLCRDVLSPLAELIDESHHACKLNVHRTLNRLANFPSAAMSMVSMDLVPRLVANVNEEEDEVIQTLLLYTISLCLRVDPRPALACNGVSVLGKQLSTPSLGIRRAALNALLAISVPLEGKERVCDGGLLPLLVKLLSDSDPEVQANAAGTIMNTVIITKGKLQALSAGALPGLLLLVSSEERAVCLNALKALTALAEAPSGRRHLLEHVPVLSSRTGAHEDQAVRRAAQCALQVVTWTP
ncbi:radial spoke head 14 homolog [Gadus morhua]|uniref:Radial spoke head 14 homolog n=1 Tax=Gadus morhua TaxID=8049 RepID=A0A8C4YVN5_GADMO|nr:radial spoke head 14 homolog [Gadus morhua]XP_030215243.1 radial spoke head 14 homolog [Gadus morhua]XP_056448154.1 radial spoke head 14 homolog isoform X1 [Gadus chalcogrammus]XP_056448156.1 radial spoke head 14 homolog isoform X1 [Gadus chalcogrammus]